MKILISFWLAAPSKTVICCLSFFTKDNFFAKKKSGAIPIPPPISKIFFFSILTVKPSPSGPRTSNSAPGFKLLNCSVPFPTILYKIVITFSFSLILKTLKGLFKRGSLPIFLGLRWINWPGLTVVQLDVFFNFNL